MKRRVTVTPFLLVCLGIGISLAVPSVSYAFNLAAPCPTTNPACQICVNGMPQDVTLGKDLITTMFDIINGILSTLSSQMYGGDLLTNPGGIINNKLFTNAIMATMLLYIALYGVMILFNLASYNPYEVAGRLMRLGIVVWFIAPGGILPFPFTGGWSVFQQYVANPMVNQVNQLIQAMGMVAGGLTSADWGNLTNYTNLIGLGLTNPLNQLLPTGDMRFMDPAAVQVLWNPITGALSSQYTAGILSLITTGYYLLALLLIWGLFEFIFMVLGALFTYVKSMVGLAFLFGVGPIFIIFLLFQKTRPLFFGWVNQMLGFALQPVMLFAFLAFYCHLIMTSLNNMFAPGGTPLDFCFVKWYSFPGGLMDLFWWRPQNPSNGLTGGDFIDWNQTPPQPFPSPIPGLSILYFVLLCSLGRDFSQAIEKMSGSLANASGVGVVTGEHVKNWFKNNITGGMGMGDAMGAIGSDIKSTLSGKGKNAEAATRRAAQVSTARSGGAG